MNNTQDTSSKQCLDDKWIFEKARSIVLDGEVKVGQVQKTDKAFYIPVGKCNVRVEILKSKNGKALGYVPSCDCKTWSTIGAKHGTLCEHCMAAMYVMCKNLWW